MNYDNNFFKCNFYLLDIISIIWYLRVKTFFATSVFSKMLNLF